MKKINRISALLAAMIFCFNAAWAQPFTGEKSSWHGFDRYDFSIDEKTLAITPITKDTAEGTGVAAPAPGTRRCIVVVPKQVAQGAPWTWRGCYWDHEPQAEIELLKRGFHVAFITTDPDTTWDAWYDFLVKEHGLSPKAAFIGMSRGGSNAYTWGTNNPDKVMAICADNPGLNASSLLKMHLLAEQDVPLLHVCGSIDPIWYNTVDIQNQYHSAGGRMSVLVKDGFSHHPHSLRDPNIIADFMESSFAELSGNGVRADEPAASFLPQRYTKSWYYGTEPAYSYLESQPAWISTWGPVFGGAYRKYFFNVERVSRLTVYAPAKPAPGMPWIYRSDVLDGSSSVDLALLERGFHVVVGPTTTSIGPVAEEWDRLYEYLVGKGFSAKPVLAGRGGATGEVYVWAESHPDRVAGIYGENPLMRSSRAEVQPMDNLAPLAAAGIPILHVCGSLDPNLEGQTREVERRYKALGGAMTVIVDEGKGHYPLSPRAPAPVIDIVAGWVR